MLQYNNLGICVSLHEHHKQTTSLSTLLPVSSPSSASRSRLKTDRELVFGELFARLHLQNICPLSSQVLATYLVSSTYRPRPNWAECLSMLRFEAYARCFQPDTRLGHRASASELGTRPALVSSAL